jgi:hypothetical protein
MYLPSLLIMRNGEGFHLTTKIMSKKIHKIHYIGKDQNHIFIIAKTKCGKGWRTVEEFTSIKSDVTCKKCKL